MDQVNILGIRIAAVGRQVALERIRGFLAGSRPRFGVTPNPEIVLAANEDEELYHILNQADLSLLDGMGLKLAAWLKGVNAPRVTGADLVPELLALAEAEGRSMLVVNWREGLSDAVELEAALKARYPRLKLKVQAVDRFGRDFDPAAAGEAAVMLVTLGAPYQEKFIYHNLDKVTGLRLAIGVGGALDFLAGKVRRAPKLLRLLGLEWSWRLFQRPNLAQGQAVLHRYRRIWRAVFVFMWRFIIWQYIRPLQYRPNVACLAYRRLGERFEILLVKRANTNDVHWQLPQGGTDGERPEVAAKREATEELGTDQFEVRAVFRNVWRYKFDGALGRYPVNRDSGYKGQKQALAILEFKGEDADIKLNYWDHSAWQWVEPERLVATVHPVRQKSTQVFLDKFREYIKSL